MPEAKELLVKWYEKCISRLSDKKLPETYVNPDTEEILLKRYVNYIEGLAKKNSSEQFTNGGVEYASQLMAVLFRYTEKEARVFCQGFKPNLIETEPYWGALQNYLNDKKKKLKVLVETDEYKDGEPRILLQQKKTERGNDGSISIRLINEEDKNNIYNSFSGKPCNFAVFDDNKYRFEYEPNGYRAFGSFNHKENSEKLISLFDKAFDNAIELN